jgi:hypothetical protein
VNQILTDYFKSYNTKEEGFSRTKIVATWVCVVVMVMQVLHGNKDNISELVLYDMGFVAACLGLKTYQSIRRSTDENPVKTTSETTLITKDQPVVTKTTTITEKPNPEES